MWDEGDNVNLEFDLQQRREQNSISICIVEKTNNTRCNLALGSARKHDFASQNLQNSMEGDMYNLLYSVNKLQPY